MASSAEILDECAGERHATSSRVTHYHSRVSTAHRRKVVGFLH